MTEFKPWPKIGRLNRDMIVTEKIDGTNGCVIIELDEEGEFHVSAQSRSRIITPEQDNHGFAKWVAANRTDLITTLGVGYHFGEWWGSGIQRGYGLPRGEKRFSLFNVKRWAQQNHTEPWVDGLDVVPVIYEGLFSSEYVNEIVASLDEFGSYAAPGFLRPEGVIVYLPQSNTLFKVTVENDGLPKSLTEENAA